MRALVFAVAVAACGGDRAPPVDAPAASVCTMPNECPCLSNDDCPDGTRCHSHAGDEVYCEPGPRGAGAAGATCTGEDDCASSLCVDGSDTMRCSKTCAGAGDCPPELPTCLGGIGICAR